MVNWWWLLRVHGVVPRTNLRLAALVTAVFAGTLPLRLVERVMVHRRVAATPVDCPIFVLGHWRSGTTHLQDLLIQDPRFGYVTNLQAMFPYSFLTFERPVRKVVGRRVPKTRNIDRMEQSLDTPQEEDIVLAGVINFSFLHGWLFPSRRVEYFRKFGLFEGVPEQFVDVWKEAYLDVLRRAACYMPGRRLLLKSPANTSRIALLLEMFPETKFVHIHRNPYQVFASTLNLYRITSALAFEKSTEPEWVEDILTIYELMMRKFLAERDRIPDGHLVEVCYDDLEARPVQTLRRVYERLDLGWLEKTEDRIQRHLESLAGYEKNPLKLSPEYAGRVEERWGFAIDLWGDAKAALGP